jgi:hypothetical protein
LLPSQFPTVSENTFGSSIPTLTPSGLYDSPSSVGLLVFDVELSVFNFMFSIDVSGSRLASGISETVCACAGLSCSQKSASSVIWKDMKSLLDPLQPELAVASLTLLVRAEHVDTIISRLKERVNNGFATSVLREELSGTPFLTSSVVGVKVIQGSLDDNVPSSPPTVGGSKEIVAEVVDMQLPAVAMSLLMFGALILMALYRAITIKTPQVESVRTFITSPTMPWRWSGRLSPNSYHNSTHEIEDDDQLTHYSNHSENSNGSSVNSMGDLLDMLEDQMTRMLYLHRSADVTQTISVETTETVSNMDDNATETEIMDSSTAIDSGRS